MGTVKDKEIERVLELLPKDAHYYFTQAHIPRALLPEDLQKKALEYSLNGQIFGDVNLALTEAMMHAAKEDIVVVSGSIFLVAEVNTEILKSNKSIVSFSGNKRLN